MIIKIYDDVLFLTPEDETENATFLDFVKTEMIVKFYHIDYLEYPNVIAIEKGV